MREGFLFGFGDFWFLGGVRGDLFKNFEILSWELSFLIFIRYIFCEYNFYFVACLHGRHYSTNL